MWEHGLLVHVPKGVHLEQPLYVRIVNSVEGGSLFWRLLVVAEPESSLHGDRGVRLRLAGALGLRQRSGRDRRRAGRQGRVRLGAVDLAGDLALRHAPCPRRARRRARLGRRRLRLEEGEGPDPERPRRAGRNVAGDRRLLRRRNSAPRLRHLPGAHRSEHDLRLRLQGRSARRLERGLARDDPRREGRPEDERLPGEPEPAALEDRARRLDSRASRSWRTTFAAPTARRWARSTASSSST